MQSGTISDSSLALYFPSIAVNDFGNAVIGFSGSDANTSVSTYIAAADTTAGVTTFGSILQTHAGTGSYERLDSSSRNRWGDYSATVIDPTNESIFWTFQEFVNGDDIWAIRVTEINTSEQPAAVPEPSSIALLAMGAIGLIGYRRRNRKQAA